MTMDSTFDGLRRRVKPAQATAFLSAIIAGYAVHLYALTNLIPNSDGLSRVFDPQQMTVSGRWFLHYASILNEFTQMPAVIGLLSLVFLGLTAAIVVDLLGIRSMVLGGITGAILVAFPSVGYTFLYMFTASAYALAILLAAVSVWLARKGRGAWLLAVVALALSMGIYQVYVTVAISLCLLALLREVLNPEATFRGTLMLGLKQVAYLAAGAAIYYIVLMIFLKVKDLELLSYLGMDAASSGYPIFRLPSLVLTAYRQVIAFFFAAGSVNGFANLWMVALDALAVALGIGCLIVWIKGNKGLAEPWRIVGGAALVILLPLGMNFGQILSPYSTPTPLMKYAYVALYLGVLMAVDLADGVKEKDQGNSKAVLMAAAGAWSVLLLLFCLNTNNLLYASADQAHRATESYATRLLTRIESCPGYEPGMEIAVVGAVPPSALESGVESYQRVSHYSVPRGTVLQLNKHIYYYFNLWLNTSVEEPDEATMIAISDSEEFQQMPLYPADGSIKVIDGRVVVRMQEKYKPKSDYEVAYEHRK